ncbi:MAG: GNAT family N-acetyltransferase [Gammaproteobacteria bacterium]|nr:GNAT family N-acetyltransferase [Gammaproteobacteria bacterium]MDE2345372.1 GNAT family N-acetyltransferase [Gammaproteobacteria bacterium]
MQYAKDSKYSVRQARPEEYPSLGKLIAEVYAGIPGFPGPDRQPEYFKMLREVGKRAANTAIRVFTAVSDSSELLGSVDFIQDMRDYGSAGTAASVPDTSGIRLLAVSPAARGMGVGKALTRYCLDQARALGRSRVCLHTTKSMQTAWIMYERMGFMRFPEIDFKQGTLEVFGFCLNLKIEM